MPSKAKNKAAALTAKEAAALAAKEAAPLAAKEAAVLAAQEEATTAAALEAEGAVGGWASGIPKNIEIYFEVRFQNMMKQIQDEFKRQGSLMDHLKVQVSTNKNEFQTAWDNITDRMAVVEHKNSVADVVLAAVKKKVRQLPASGNIKKLFEERNANETASTILTVYGEDSSFYNRTSVLAQIETLDYVVQCKEYAPEVFFEVFYARS